jgi:hypothetical protein
MPYPPDFDNAWDISTPANTQLASLGAQDIRDLKDDIMQRMALLSGNLANRPTPETVNAIWGGTGYGLLFFATDVHRTYQWSGAAWVDVTYLIGGGASATIDDSENTVTNAAVYTTLNQVIIPAGVVSAGTVIEIDATVKITSGAVTTLKLTDNAGTTILGASYAYVLDTVKVSSRIFVHSGSQILHGSEFRTYAGSANGLYIQSGSASVDLIGTNTFTVQGHSGGLGVIIGYGMIAKVVG